MERPRDFMLEIRAAPIQRLSMRFRSRAFTEKLGLGASGGPGQSYIQAERQEVGGTEKNHLAPCLACSVANREKLRFALRDAGESDLR